MFSATFCLYCYLGIEYSACGIVWLCFHHFWSLWYIWLRSGLLLLKWCLGTLRVFVFISSGNYFVGRRLYMNGIWWSLLPCFDPSHDSNSCHLYQKSCRGLWLPNAQTNGKQKHEQWARYRIEIPYTSRRYIQIIIVLTRWSSKRRSSSLEHLQKWPIDSFSSFCLASIIWLILTVKQGLTWQHDSRYVLEVIHTFRFWGKDRDVDYWGMRIFRCVGVVLPLMHGPHSTETP